METHRSTKWRACIAAMIVALTIIAGGLAGLAGLPASAATTSPWSPPTNIDPNTGYNGTGYTGIKSVSCPTTTFCMAVDGYGNGLQYDGNSWTITPQPIDVGNYYGQPTINPFLTVSCPVAGTCVGSDFAGNVVGYTNPPGWLPRQDLATTNRLYALSCGSATFCMVVTNVNDTFIWTGQTAAGGQMVWHDISRQSTNPAYNPWTLACVYDTTINHNVCYLGDQGGGISTWTDSAGWTGRVAVAVNSAEITGISCPTSTFCMASTDFTGWYSFNGSNWTGPLPDSGGVPGHYNVQGVSCPTTAFCLSVNTDGKAYTFNGASWSSGVDIDAYVDQNGSRHSTAVNSVSCPTSTFCVAVDAAGNYMTYRTATAGTVQGLVTDSRQSPPSAVAQAAVQLCGPNGCFTTATDSNGQYAVAGVVGGSYTVAVSPPEGSTLNPATAGPATLDVNQSPLVLNVAMTGPIPFPSNTTIGHVATTANGVPVLYWRYPSTISVTGPPGCTGSVTVTAVNRETGASNTVNVTLAEEPPGTYTGTIPPLYPLHGLADVGVTISCMPTFDFTIYIDPSGKVVDQNGVGVSGATVTLLAASSPAGPFTPVPQGSPVMSPANRVNPDTTRPDGTFGWDALAGYYEVRASAPNCTSPTDSSSSTVTSAVITIPPPMTDLQLQLKCQQSPVIQWSNPADISYGTPLGSTQLDASVVVPGQASPPAGTINYFLADMTTPANGAVLHAGTGQVLNAVFTPTDTTSFTSAAGQASITVTPAPQSIAFSPVRPHTYGDPAFTVSAVGGASGNPVTFTLGAADTCSLSNTSGGSDQAGDGVGSVTVTLTGAGSCTLTANQLGGGDYQPAAAVSQPFTVAKATPALSWAAPADIVYGTPLSGTQLDATVTTAGATGTLAYTVDGGTQPAAGQVLPAGPHTLAVAFTPDQTSSSNYTSATDSVTVTVDQVSQQIGFTSLPDHVYLDPPFTLAATGGASGNPVVFSASGSCTVAGATLTITGAGSCTVTANQAGAANYLPAATVSQAFQIAKASSTLTLPPIGNHTYGDAPFQVNVAGDGASSPVTLGAGPSSVCSISGSTVTLVAPGACSVVATQAGDANYNPSPSVTQSFAVTYLVKVLTDLSEPFHTGRTIPIKLELTSSTGANVSVQTVTVHAQSLDGGPVPSHGRSQPDSNFRFSSDLPGYIFNVSTKGLATGTHTLVYTAGDDPTAHTIQFQTS